jgi:hypothetical protein
MLAGGQLSTSAAAAAVAMSLLQPGPGPPAWPGTVQLDVSTDTETLGVMSTMMDGRGAVTGPAGKLAAAADTTGLRSPASMASWLRLKLPLQDRLELAARSEPSVQRLLSAA